MPASGLDMPIGYGAAREVIWCSQSHCWLIYWSVKGIMRCIHGLILEQCAHCNGAIDDMGSDDLNADQTFEWTLVNIDGQQLTVTWCDGTVVPWSRKFTFGRVGASLMIDCADAINQFVSSSNPAEVSRGVRSMVTEAGTTIRIFPDFTLENGRQIDRPYIRLERHEGYWHPRIGLGRVRARAFLHFETEIRKWAAAGN